MEGIDSATCAICLDQMGGKHDLGAPYYLPACHHTFHESCITMCPRKGVSGKQLQKIAHFRLAQFISGNTLFPSEFFTDAKVEIIKCPSCNQVSLWKDRKINITLNDLVANKEKIPLDMIRPKGVKLVESFELDPQKYINKNLYTKSVFFLSRATTSCMKFLAKVIQAVVFIFLIVLYLLYSLLKTRFGKGVAWVGGICGLKYLYERRMRQLK